MWCSIVLLVVFVGSFSPQVEASASDAYDSMLIALLVMVDAVLLLSLGFSGSLMLGRGRTGQLASGFLLRSNSVDTTRLSKHCMDTFRHMVQKVTADHLKVSMDEWQ